MADDPKWTIGCPDEGRHTDSQFDSEGRALRAARAISNNWRLMVAVVRDPGGTITAVCIGGHAYVPID